MSSSISPFFNGFSVKVSLNNSTVDLVPFSVINKKFEEIKNIFIESNSNSLINEIEINKKIEEASSLPLYRERMNLAMYLLSGIRKWYKQKLFSFFEIKKTEKPLSSFFIQQILLEKEIISFFDSKKINLIKKIFRENSWERINQEKNKNSMHYIFQLQVPLLYHFFFKENPICFFDEIEFKKIKQYFFVQSNKKTTPIDNFLDNFFDLLHGYLFLIRQPIEKIELKHIEHYDSFLKSNKIREFFNKEYIKTYSLSLKRKSSIETIKKEIISTIELKIDLLSVDDNSSKDMQKVVKSILDYNNIFIFSSPLFSNQKTDEIQQKQNALPASQFTYFSSLSNREMLENSPHAVKEASYLSVYSTKKLEENTILHQTQLVKLYEGLLKNIERTWKNVSVLPVLRDLLLKSNMRKFLNLSRITDQKKMIVILKPFLDFFYKNEANPLLTKIILTDAIKRTKITLFNQDKDNIETFLLLENISQQFIDFIIPFLTQNSEEELLLDAVLSHQKISSLSNGETSLLYSAQNILLMTILEDLKQGVTDQKKILSSLRNKNTQKKENTSKPIMFNAISSKPCYIVTNQLNPSITPLTIIIKSGSILGIALDKESRDSFNLLKQILPKLPDNSTAFSYHHISLEDLRKLNEKIQENFKNFCSDSLEFYFFCYLRFDPNRDKPLDYTQPLKIKKRRQQNEEASPKKRRLYSPSEIEWNPLLGNSQLHIQNLEVENRRDSIKEQEDVVENCLEEMEDIEDVAENCTEEMENLSEEIEEEDLNFPVFKKNKSSFTPSFPFEDDVENGFHLLQQSLINFSKIIHRKEKEKEVIENIYEKVKILGDKLSVKQASAPIIYQDKVLYPYQQNAVKKLLDLRQKGINGAITLKPGLGKTKCMLEIAFQNLLKSTLPVLMITTKSLQSQLQENTIDQLFDNKLSCYSRLLEILPSLTDSNVQMLSESIARTFFFHYNHLYKTSNEIKLKTLIEQKYEDLIEKILTQDAYAGFFLIVNLLKQDQENPKHPFFSGNKLISFAEKLIKQIEMDRFNEASQCLQLSIWAALKRDKIASPIEKIRGLIQILSLNYFPKPIEQVKNLLSKLKGRPFYGNQHAENQEFLNLWNDLLDLNPYESVMIYQPMQKNFKNRDYLTKMKWAIIIANSEGIKENSILLSVEYSSIHIDEVHNLSDSLSAKRTSNVIRLLKNASHHPHSPMICGYTGTPFVNKVFDMINLFQLINPSLDFSSLGQFTNQLQNQLEETLIHLASNKKLEDKEKEARQLDLKSTLNHCLIVYESLRKIIQEMTANLTKEEIDTNTPQTEFLTKTLSLTPSQQVQIKQVNEKIQETNSLNIFSSTTDHKKIIFHPQLKVEKKIQDYLNEMKTWEVSKWREFTQESALLMELINPEGELAQTVKNNKHALIFVSEIKFGKILKKLFLSDHGFGKEVIVKFFNGSKTSQARKEIIQEYEEKNLKKAFILISTEEVGGVGLNLPSTHLLIQFDLGWTASGLLQRRARAVRFGKKETTKIYQISFDTMIDLLQQSKINKKDLLDQIFLSENPLKIIFPSILEFIIENTIQTSITITDYQKFKTYLDTQRQLIKNVLFPLKEEMMKDLSDPSSPFSRELDKFLDVFNSMNKNDSINSDLTSKQDIKIKNPTKVETSPIESLPISNNSHQIAYLLNPEPLKPILPISDDSEKIQNVLISELKTQQINKEFPLEDFIKIKNERGKEDKKILSCKVCLVPFPTLTKENNEIEILSLVNKINQMDQRLILSWIKKLTDEQWKCYLENPNQFLEKNLESPLKFSIQKYNFNEKTQIRFYYLNQDRLVTSEPYQSGQSRVLSHQGKIYFLIKLQE
jgi:superfamily II DNA or RNA helicase